MIRSKMFKAMLCGMLLFPAFLQAQNQPYFTPDTVLEKQIAATHIHDLKAGDSIVIYESRIITSNVSGPVNDGGVMVALSSLFSSKPDTKYFSRTSKYVIRNVGGVFSLHCYVSDKSRYPNFGFDRVMKKDGKWHFKKYSEKTLSAIDVRMLCIFEMDVIKKEISKYDEGDVSKDITVIKHGKKVITSGYCAATALDSIMSSKY